MRNRFLLLLGCLALGGALPLAPAQACTVDDTYRVPTNLALVERADTIVLGVVESGPSEEEYGDGSQLAIRPTLLLKGGALPAEIRVDAMIAAPGHAITRDPNELEEANPDSFRGACVRYRFRRGATVLWFLGRENGALVPLAFPHARWAEDVLSPDSPWVRAVRLYVEVAALPQTERRDALIVRRDALLAQTGDPVAAIIAADIDRQLRGPNQPWNAIMNQLVEDMVQALERDGFITTEGSRRRPHSRQ